MKNKLIGLVLFLISGIVSGQTLQDYLQLASENSPDLQAALYRYEAALEKVTEVHSLPNTTFGLGYFLQEAETRVGAQKVKLSVNQQLPWFGTLSKKAESASFKAASLKNEMDFIKRKLHLEVKKSYYEIYENRSKNEIIKEHLMLLTTLEEHALTELENNRTTMVELLRIRMEKNELSDLHFALNEEFKAKQIAFNLLLNSNPDSEVIVMKPEFQDFKSVDFSKILLSENPQLKRLGNLQQALHKSEEGIKKESMPAIGLGMDYVFVDHRSGIDISDNGKDIIMPMVTVSVPLFSKKYSSKQKQIQLEQKEMASSIIAIENDLRTQFEIAQSKLLRARSSIKVQDNNIVEAQQAKEVLLAGYQASKIDFEQVLEIQQLQLQFQLKKVEYEREFGFQNSILEFLLNKH
jgi:outer membrane protein TolC